MAFWGAGRKLSRGGRKYEGRGGGVYVLSRYSEFCRPSSGSLRGLCPHEAQAAEPTGSSDVVLAGEAGSVLSTFFFRALHAFIAFARQLLLTFAREAAASESFSFSAYPQILGPVDVDKGLGSGVASSGGIGDKNEDGDNNGEFEEEAAGDKGVKGEGGTSIEDWFVMPRQTVLAKRDVIPGGPRVCGVSVSLPSSSISWISSSSSSSLSDNWLAKPFHMLTVRRAARPIFSVLDALVSSSRR